MTTSQNMPWTLLSLVILYVLSLSEGCKNASSLTRKIGYYLFPDYVVGHEMNDINHHRCESIIVPADVLIIHGPLCESFPPIRMNEVGTTMISLKWTSIRVLHHSSFPPWNTTKRIDISNNDKLKALSKGAFHGLSDLERLSINDNKMLDSLHEETFVSLFRLRELSLVRNAFLNIYDVTKAIKVTSVPSIHSVDLSGNPIRTLKQDDFSTMTQLVISKLILNRVHLEEIGPEPFNKLSGLKHLELGSTAPNKKHDDLLKSLNKIEHLSILKLENIDMSDYTDTLIKTLTEYSYRSISIKGTTINKLDITRDVTVISLNHIELSDSLITVFPVQLFHPEIFPFLRSVIMKNNTFHSIPNNISTSNLKLIDLSSNIINRLTNNSFYFAPELQVLILSDVSLEYIDNDAFADNKKLVFLDLSKNYFEQSIKNFDKDIFKNLINLEALDLSDCSIEQFDNIDLFDHLINLKYLSLKSNYLKQIDIRLFDPLLCLNKLDLRLNKLLFLNVSITSKHNITDIGLFSTIYKVDNEFKSILQMLTTNERDEAFKNCTQTEIITRNEQNQIVDLEFKPNDKKGICRIYLMENNNDNEESTNPNLIDNKNENITANVTVIEEDRFEFVYILFRPYYVYNSLSYNAINILRFLYVFTFYLIVILALSLIAVKLIKCARNCRKNKRQIPIFDSKIDFKGFENKAYTIPYEKMKDDNLPQKS